MDEFRRLLHELVASYGGTKQDLARAVRITPSSLSHLLAEQATHAPSSEVCIRLAHATGTSASKILRAAGKGALADLIEDMYGETAARRQPFIGARLTPQEEQHMRAVRALDTRAKRAFLFIVEAAAVTRIRRVKALPFRDGAAS